MPLFPIFCAVLLAGCSDPAPQVIISPAVPGWLRAPCSPPSLSGITTEGEAADAIVGLRRALLCANDRITSINEILLGAEEMAEGS